MNMIKETLNRLFPERWDMSQKIIVCVIAWLLFNFMMMAITVITAALGIGGLPGACLIAAGIYFLVKRRRNRKNKA